MKGFVPQTVMVNEMKTAVLNGVPVMRFWIMLSLLALAALGAAEANARASISGIYQFGSLKPAVDAWQAKDYARARELAAPLADVGDPDAQFMLAELLYNGMGGPSDQPQARTLYIKAAMAGHVPAQYTLGELAFQGSGVKQDYSRAAGWFEEAAKSGHGLAKVRLGYLYLEGLGVAKDTDRAAALFREAADLGEAAGQYHLGLMYLTGNGFALNYAEAASWFELAAKQGDGDSQYNLALILEGGLICEHRRTGSCRADPELAAYWMERAADNGVRQALTSMGLLAFNGRGVDQSARVAADWFEKAAEAGDPEGMFLYAVALAEGTGRTRNIDLAFSWAKKSAALSENEPEPVRFEREALRDQLEEMLYKGGNSGPSMAARRNLPATAESVSLDPATVVAAQTASADPDAGEEKKPRRRRLRD